MTGLVTGAGLCKQFSIRAGPVKGAGLCNAVGPSRGRGSAVTRPRSGGGLGVTRIVM